MGWQRVGHDWATKVNWEEYPHDLKGELSTTVLYPLHFPSPCNSLEQILKQTRLSSLDASSSNKLVNVFSCISTTCACTPAKGLTGTTPGPVLKGLTNARDAHSSPFTFKQASLGTSHVPGLEIQQWTESEALKGSRSRTQQPEISKEINRVIIAVPAMKGNVIGCD